MSALYHTITQLCAQRGITITELCRQSGASRGSLTDLKMGRKQSLSAATLAKIAAYLGVSIDEILGTHAMQPAKRIPTDNPDLRHPYLLGKYLDGTITPQEQEELDKWQRLNRIAGYLDQLTEQGREEAEKRVKELCEIPRYQAQPAAPAPEHSDCSQQ